jgi:hypothetical protein
MFLCRPRRRPHRPPYPRLRRWSRREPGVTHRRPPIRLRASLEPDVILRPLHTLPQARWLRRPRRRTLPRAATSAARRCPVRLVRRQRRRQVGRRPRCQTALPAP